MRTDQDNKTRAATSKDKAEKPFPNTGEQPFPNTGEQDLLNTGEQPLLNTGPDAVIGYGVATGEPLTKRQVFGQGNQPGQASQHIHSGPELTGVAEVERSTAVTNLEDLQSDSLQAEGPLNRAAVNQYETEKGSSGGWHSAKSKETPP